MSQVKLAAIAIVLGGLAILASSAFFTVGQAQQALVLQFGAPVRVVQEPGLQVKIPFVQNVLYFEKRLLDFDDTPREIVMGDQARIVVDVFARYRIRDPLMFFTSARNEAGCASVWPMRCSRTCRTRSARRRWARCSPIGARR